MNIRKDKFSKWADSFAIVMLFAGILFFLAHTGTLNSGYHFIDDHEMIVIHSDLEKAPVISVTGDWIKKDLNIRFRPMYFVHRVLEMKIFGTDFFALSFYTGVLAALSFIFFYLGARKIKFSVFESAILVFLTFVGTQASVWWMLGPNETIGMFFLGLAFLFLAKSGESKHYFRNSVLFIVFLIASSLSKESFVIVVPAFIFLKIWNESRAFGISFRESVQKNYLSSFSLAAMAVELWIIFFVVGTNKIGYAGASSSIKELVSGIWMTLVSENMLLGWLKLLLFLSILFIIQPFFNSGKRVSKSNAILDLIPVLFFSVLVVVPNIILNAKTGMVERYLLPSTLGLAILAAAIIRNTEYKILRALAFLVCLIFLLFQLKIAQKSTFAFAEEGRQTNELLSGIVSHSNPDSKILLVVDPVDRFEVSDSFRIYLSYNGINNLYAFPVKREYKSGFERGLEKTWEKWFEGRGIENIGGLPDEIVFIDKNQKEKFFAQSGISEDHYVNILRGFNPHLLLVKK